MPSLSSLSRRAAVVQTVLLAVLIGACASSRSLVPEGTGEPDKFLFDRGNEALKEKQWIRAREYLVRLIDSYPQSPYRADAKLAVGDSYLGEGSTESLALATNEFREFLTFYPTHLRADYAQFQLGMVHLKQMRGPERDQTETKEAVKEFEAFIERYPSSALMPDATARLREARDRVGDSDFRVGLFYFRSRWYPGAIERFKTLLKADAGYTRRDAVYFHLAEALVRTEKTAEALPYYERLLEEFAQSEYLDETKQRIEQLKTKTS